MPIYAPLFHALNESGIRYVVVGGVAVVLHGYPRFTADIDLIVDFDPESLRRAMDALQQLGLVPRAPVDATDFADPTIREGWVREKRMQVFSLYAPDNPLLSVDLFVRHPVDFEPLWARADAINLESNAIRVASIPDLIYLKRLVNRPRDLDDIEKLEAIVRRREGKANE